MGLRIFLLDRSIDLSVYTESLYIYEIYPESTSLQLTQIAYTRISGSYSKIPYSISYDCLVFARGDVLTIWDYKANTWARWGTEGKYSKIIATKSTVMLILPYGVSVWEIPPLLPESSLSMSTDPFVMSPLFEFHYPENYLYHEFHQAPCDWYSGIFQPLYYDVVGNPGAHPLNINRFEVPTINSKISGGNTLNQLKTFEAPSEEGYHYSIGGPSRICQDKNVSIYTDAYTSFLGNHVSNIYDQQLPSFVALLCHPNDVILYRVSLCPVAGRVVYYEHDPYSSDIVILDF